VPSQPWQLSGRRGSNLINATSSNESVSQFLQFLHSISTCTGHDKIQQVTIMEMFDGTKTIIDSSTLSLWLRAERPQSLLILIFFYEWIKYNSNVVNVLNGLHYIYDCSEGNIDDLENKNHIYFSMLQGDTLVINVI
jgi:hypothetical protein